MNEQINDDVLIREIDEAVDERKSYKPVVKRFERVQFRVQIRDDLKKNTILGIESRLPISLIFGMSGYRNEVMPLL